MTFCWHKYGRYFTYVLLTVVLMVLFESAQQYFYIIRFELIEQSERLYSQLFFNHFHRWMIWLLVTVVFLLHQLKHPTDEQPDKGFMAVKIIQLVLVNIVMIALVESIKTDVPVTVATVSEMLVFFFFQKTPIYTLSYIALLAVYGLLNLKDNLQLEIVALNDLSEKQKEAFNAQQQVLNAQDKARTEEKPAADDELAMLSIKVGNSYKMIAVEDICWVEAYDYCVKIHTHDAEVFAMRNSLKALEKQLTGKHFLRIHRKAIVNMQKATEVSFNPTPKVVLDNELSIDIAQSRVKDVKAYLQ